MDLSVCQLPSEPVVPLLSVGSNTRRMAVACTAAGLSELNGLAKIVLPVNC
jgi:hypothetical protein